MDHRKVQSMPRLQKLSLVSLSQARARGAKIHDPDSTADMPKPGAPHVILVQKQHMAK